MIRTTTEAIGKPNRYGEVAEEVGHMMATMEDLRMALLEVRPVFRLQVNSPSRACHSRLQILMILSWL